MTIGKLRSLLYGTARILGDVNAIQRGTIAQRVVRRATGRLAARGLGAFMRLAFPRRRR